MTIWKLGCNWGSNTPIFYEFIKEEKIVISAKEYPYQPDDIVVISEGYNVRAIAKVLKPLEPVTNNSDLTEPFKKHQIPFSEDVYFASAEWYELKEYEKFQYRLQAGIRLVRKKDILKKVKELWKYRNKKYWIFQGNPKKFDFETAVKQDLINDWTVSAHKDKIKTGDKVIIWLSGKNSGCYGLAEITSEPREKELSTDDDLWKEENKNTLKADIRITHNFWNNPILWKNIETNKELKNLNVNLQGTNFSATYSEYKTLIHLSETRQVDHKPAKNKPLNQILFGPPGTGKTYHTINKTLSIIEGISEADLKKENRSILKDRFNKYIEDKRVVFTTFHQSMSYEDFVEGIKPQAPEETTGQVSYKVEPGILKNIVKSADSRKGNFLEVIESFKAEISEADNKESITIKAPGTTFDVVYKSGTVFYVSPHNSVKENPSYPVSIDNVEKYFYTNSLEGIYNPTYVKGILNFLFEKRGLQKSRNEENFNKPHVLIIDEINRGNVSQIFGELITLIEKDKRAGNDEALEATLPYSKEKFSIPANLYIIGTMNTADRSVEALDSALRRRFSFQEMPPKYDLEELDYSVFGYQASSILRKINYRIEKLLDKDHMIGHSFFIEKDHSEIAEKIITSFYENIIPLLQEYFFGDFGKIGLVLGEGFVKIKDWDNTKGGFAPFNYDGAGDFDDRTVFEIIDYRYDSNQSGFYNAIKILMNDSE